MTKSTDPENSRVDLVQGTLDLLILKTLGLQALHGWGISERILQMSGGQFEVNPGSLYPALERLKRKGHIESHWQTTRNNRRARYYTLTSSGRSQLRVEEEKWQTASGAVNRLLREAAQEG